MYSVIAKFSDADAIEAKSLLSSVNGVECSIVNDSVLILDTEGFLTAFESARYLSFTWADSFVTIFSSSEVASIMMASLFNEFESRCEQRGLFVISFGLGELATISKKVGFTVASSSLSLLGENRFVLYYPGNEKADTANLALKLASSNFEISRYSFVGRQNLVTELWDEVWNRNHVCLTGCGGVGKTRLAKEIAAYGAKNGCSKVSLVSLSENRSTSQARSSLQNLLKSLSNRTNGFELVVIDNCEHVLDAVYHFLNDSDFSENTAKLLFTSREVISFPGVSNRPVPGLSLPDDQQIARGEYSCEALTLLDDRSMVFRETGLRDEDFHDAALLVKLVSGLPLAIEQIASNLDKFSIREIYEQLKNRLHKLEFSIENNEPRHQTMLATMEWSFGLLSQSESKVFGICSSFEGNFKPSHVEAFLSKEDSSQSLRNLERKSLINRAHINYHSKSLEVLECVRDCARVSLPNEILRTSDLVEFCLKVIFDSYATTEGKSGDWHLEDMRILHRTIEVGLDFLSDTNDPRLPAALTKAYRYYTSSGNPSNILPYFERTFKSLHPNHPEYLSILNGKAQLEWHSGNIELARQSLEKLSRISAEFGDKVQSATALSNLAVLELNHGDPTQAEVPLREAREIFLQHGEVSRYWAVTANLVYISVVNGSSEFLDLARKVVGSVESDIPPHLLPVLYVNFSDIFEMAGDHEGREYCLRHILEVALQDGTNHSFEPAVLRMIPTVYGRDPNAGAFLFGMIQEYLEDSENAGRKRFLERHRDVFSELESGDYQDYIVAGNFVVESSRALEAFRRTFPSNL